MGGGALEIEPPDTEMAERHHSVAQERLSPERKREVVNDATPPVPHHGTMLKSNKKDNKR